MKKRIAWLLVPFLMGISLVLASCAQSAQTTPTTSTVPTTSKTATAAPQPTSGDTLSEILGWAQNIPTMKYTVVMTMPGVPATTTTTWVKKNKMRMEMSMQGITTVLLVDQDTKTMYSYMPAQNMAMKMSYDQASKSATEEAGSIAGYNPKTVGTESIDGKACLVVEFTVEQTTTKMWIWKDRGLPLKTEMTTTTGKTTIEYKNYDFSDIPDSMFDLPSGVQVISSGT